jgi:hypothetical protein
MDYATQLMQRSAWSVVFKSCVICLSVYLPLIFKYLFIYLLWCWGLNQGLAHASQALYH